MDDGSAVGELWITGTGELMPMNRGHAADLRTALHLDLALEPDFVRRHAMCGLGWVRVLLLASHARAFVEFAPASITRETLRSLARLLRERAQSAFVEFRDAEGHCREGWSLEAGGDDISLERRHWIHRIERAIVAEARAHGNPAFAGRSLVERREALDAPLPDHRSIEQPLRRWLARLAPPARPSARPPLGNAAAGDSDAQSLIAELDALNLLGEWAHVIDARASIPEAFKIDRLARGTDRILFSAEGPGERVADLPDRLFRASALAAYADAALRATGAPRPTRTYVETEIASGNGVSRRIAFHRVILPTNAACTRLGNERLVVLVQWTEIARA